MNLFSTLKFHETTTEAEKCKISEEYHQGLDIVNGLIKSYEHFKEKEKRLKENKPPQSMIEAFEEVRKAWSDLGNAIVKELKIDELAFKLNQLLNKLIKHIKGLF